MEEKDLGEFNEEKTLGDLEKLQRTPSISDQLVKMLPAAMLNQQGQRIFRGESQHASEPLDKMLERHSYEADELFEMRRLVKDAEDMDQIGS